MFTLTKVADMGYLSISTADVYTQNEVYYSRFRDGYRGVRRAADRLRSGNVHLVGIDGHFLITLDNGLVIKSKKKYKNAYEAGEKWLIKNKRQFTQSKIKVVV